MAVYNEILVGRFSRGLQKLFGIKGTVPAKTLEGAVMPVVVTENMMSLELRLVQSWRSWANLLTAAAGGAGNTSAVRLRNPAGSNVIAVIEKILFVGGATGDFPVINRGPTGTADFGTIIPPGNVRDVRIGPIGPTLVLSSSTNAGARVRTTWWQGALPVNGSSEAILYENQELVLGPSDVMTLYSFVLNFQLSATVFWRERALEEGELAGLL